MQTVKLTDSCYMKIAKNKKQKKKLYSCLWMMATPYLLINMVGDAISNDGFAICLLIFIILG